MPALSACHLYGILDLGYVDANAAPDMARRMLAGGVDILQLRAKRLAPPAILELALAVAPICREHGVAFIINDYPALVGPAGATGGHIGQDDGPIDVARAAAGSGAVIGRSTHSLAQLRAGCAEGADYLGFGPLFATPTKPDYTPIGIDDIAAAHALAGDLPVFCIGGVKLENLPTLRAAGARRVVIVSGILRAPDVESYCREARAILA